MAHLDLKLENLLISDDCSIKLCDFGFCESLHSKTYATLGSQGYMAPEIKISKSYDRISADVFALGVVLFILEFGGPPFEEASASDPLYRRIPAHRAFFSSHPATARAFREGGVDTDMADLIMAMLDPNPGMRPKSVKEVRNHEYLRGARG